MPRGWAGRAGKRNGWMEFRRQNRKCNVPISLDSLLLVFLTRREFIRSTMAMKRVLLPNSSQEPDSLRLDQHQEEPTSSDLDFLSAVAAAKADQEGREKEGRSQSMHTMEDIAAQKLRKLQQPPRHFANSRSRAPMLHESAEDVDVLTGFYPGVDSESEEEDEEWIDAVSTTPSEHAFPEYKDSMQLDEEEEQSDEEYEDDDEYFPGQGLSYESSFNPIFNSPIT